MTIEFDMGHIADYLHETAQERLQNHSHEEHMAEVLQGMGQMTKSILLPEDFKDITKALAFEMLKDDHQREIQTQATNKLMEETEQIKSELV